MDKPEYKVKQKNKKNIKVMTIPRTKEEREKKRNLY